MSLSKLRKGRIFYLAWIFAFWTAILFCCSESGKLYAASAVIPTGTSVVLEVTALVNSEAVNPGDSVQVKVAQDVEVNGKVVIKGGTAAVAKVASVEKKGMLGAPGKITVEVVSTTDVDGKKVGLSGSLFREGKSKVVTSVLLGILICILFLFFIKGGDAEITPGTQIRATTV